MYIFSDIQLLLILASLKVFDDATDSFYVTEMALESPCYDHVQKEKLKLLVEEGKIKTFSLERPFFTFSCKESIKYNGLHVMDFAAIYYSKTNKYFLVERNPRIRECAIENGVDTLPVEEILNTIIKDKKYVAYIKNL